VTNAHNIIYEVWLVKSLSTGLKPLNGENPIKASVFPNPTKSNINLNLELPYESDVDLYITDVNGKIIFDKNFEKLPKGKQYIDLSNSLKLSNGIYSFNFVFDGKYSAIDKVIIGE
jgi:hypothetical protein